MAANLNTNGVQRNGLRIAVWGMAAAVWLLPVIAMRFTREVNWGPVDFLVWAVMLGTAAGLYELGTRMSANIAYRAGFALAVLTGFFITWSNLAVGIIGNENNPLNLIFFAILALGFVGALIARFQAVGMARTLTVVAIVQGATVLLGLYADSLRVAVILSIFTAMWLFSAHLFRKA